MFVVVVVAAAIVAKVAAVSVVISSKHPEWPCCTDRDCLVVVVSPWVVSSETDHLIGVLPVAVAAVAVVVASNGDVVPVMVEIGCSLVLR